MRLLLTRTKFTEKSTIGNLYIDGDYFCHTLEDVVRPRGEKKVPGETAIPEGTYKVEFHYSPKFKRIMPRLLDVPGFDGILIHAGNTDADTAGCILVGYVAVLNRIALSSVALKTLLFDHLLRANDAQEEIWITVTSDLQPLEPLSFSSSASSPSSSGRGAENGE